MDHDFGDFIWDSIKERANILKHGIDFVTAAEAFLDPQRGIYLDSRHSGEEFRFFCIGRTKGGIITVRFVYREGRIRIFGAGRWRKGVRHYEKKD